MMPLVAEEAPRPEREGQKSSCSCGERFNHLTAPPIHVLHIETGLHLYGGALQVQYLLEGLKKQRCRNTLVCAESSEIGRAIPDTVAATFPLRFSGELDPRFFFRLLDIIRSARPHILHIHSRRGADFWGITAGRICKRKVVLTRRVDNPEISWIARAKYRQCDTVITISEGIRDVLVSEGVPASKIVCIPSAVDSAPYQEPCEKQWFWKEFELQPQDRTVGMVAQFIPRKGHRYLIEASGHILAQFPESRFLLFGQGPLEEETRQLCRRQKVARFFRFAGFRKDLQRILPCLDLVVHPATMEGLGVSLLEAAASARPIVATRAGGIPEVVHHGVNGYLVPPADVPALVRSVLNVLQNPDGARRLGEAGREMVRSRFSILQMVRGNFQVYRDVLSRRD